MIAIEDTVPETVIFLECGCCVRRFINHPTGKAALVEIIQRCETHAGETERLRAIPSGAMVSQWVRTPVTSLKP
jgi:hypothetical protein